MRWGRSIWQARGGDVAEASDFFKQNFRGNTKISTQLDITYDLDFISLEHN